VTGLVAARAEGLLRTIEAEAKRGGSLHCARCGEDSPANFDLCWKCGASI